MKMPILKATRGLRAICLAALFFILLAANVYPKDITNRFDFDGDFKADISVYREGGSDAGTGPRSVQAYTPSIWYHLSPLTAVSGAIGWGRTLDVPIPADFIGDHKTDAVIFRWFDPGEIPFEFNQIWIHPLLGPVAGFGNTHGRKFGRNFVVEAKGDQKAELGELQRIKDPNCPSSTPYIYGFYHQTNATGGLAAKVTNVPGGQCASYEQVPVPDDYNGDGKSEIAVFNTDTGCYHIWGLDPMQPDALTTPPCFGSGFIPSPGYYDGDNSADYAAVTAGSGNRVWHVRYASSPSSLVTETFPDSADGKPVAADYLGDGRTDFAIVKVNGNNWQWRILPCSGCAVSIHNFGFVTDVPLPGPYFTDPWY